MQPIVIAIAIYVLVYPIIFRLMAYAHTELRVKPAMERARKNKARNKDLPQPIWASKWGPRIKFALTDNRSAKIGKKDIGSLQYRHVTAIIWAIGLLVAIYAGMSEGIGTILATYVIAFVVFMIAMSYGMSTAKSVVDVRKNKIQKMFDIGVSKLGISRDEHPNSVVTVREWRDLVFPQEVSYELPTSFEAHGEEAFLRHFNQVFGTETTFVAHNTQESGKHGWNYEESIVTIRAVPPLPTIAKWDAKYVMDERIAWSFFPIALGVENGVELVDKETGEKEYVLGFDLAGEQGSLASKMGVNIGGEITAAPMVLIAGGTGGGKASASDTPVMVWEED